MGWWCHGFGRSGLGTTGVILNVAFSVGLLVVLGLGIFWLVRQLSRRPTVPQGTADSLEIARRRLASGEITIAEFDEVRTRLQSGFK
jgi:uncharacterized membrane protein